MDSYHLRAIILKLQDRLSDNDRKRLHFFLGNDVPRRFRDDPSLGGTLSVIESLFDQDKINEQDFTFLINAFDEIHCIDAVKILKDHMRRMRGRNNSMQSLASIMPLAMEQLLEDQDEDKFPSQNVSIEQRNIYGNNNMTINSMNTNINPVTTIIDNQTLLSSQKKRKLLLNIPLLTYKRLLLLALLLIIGLGVVIGFCIHRIYESEKKSKPKEEESHDYSKFVKEDNWDYRGNCLGPPTTETTYADCCAQCSKYDKCNGFTWKLDTNECFLKSIVGNSERSDTDRVVCRRRVIPNIPANARWAQNGLTVAGSNMDGNATHQLNSPTGLDFDDDEQTIFIADHNNHRIVQRKMSDTASINGQVVAGGNGQGNRLDQLYRPSDVMIDKETNSLIISDNGNRRIVRWSLRQGTTQGEIILDDIDCARLTMDDQRRLYVSIWDKYEVRRYEKGDKKGTVVAGGYGPGDALNQLNGPYCLFVDREQALYVSDDSHRVMKWSNGAKEGIIVAGGHGHGSALTQLFHPKGIFIDRLGTVYVADELNYRVMRWLKGATQGTVIAGGNGLGDGANQLNRPFDLSFDRHGNLYVIERYNHRVQRFSIVGVALYLYFDH